MSTIQARTENGVLTIVLNRPEAKNALDLPMVDQMTEALAKAGKPGGPRVVVIASSVKGYFSIGMDLMALEAGVGNGATSPQVYEACKHYAALLQVIASLRCPTIAAVNGMAVGGGVDLVSSCDLAIASEDAAFSVAQLRKGIFPLTTSGVVVPRIGERTFLHWVLSGQNWSAKKALRVGLVNEVVKKGEAELRAQQLATHVLGFSEETLRLGMDALRSTQGRPVVERLDTLGDLLALNCLIPRPKKKEA